MRTESERVCWYLWLSSTVTRVFFYFTLWLILVGFQYFVVWLYEKILLILSYTTWVHHRMEEGTDKNYFPLDLCHYYNGVVRRTKTFPFSLIHYFKDVIYFTLIQSTMLFPSVIRKVSSRKVFIHLNPLRLFKKSLEMCMGNFSIFILNDIKCMDFRDWKNYNGSPS